MCTDTSSCYHHLVISTNTSACYYHPVSCTDTASCYHHLVIYTDTLSCYHREMSSHTLSTNKHRDTNAQTRPVHTPFNTASSHFLQRGWCDVIDTRTVNNYKSMYLIHRPLESILGHGMTSESATFSCHLVHHIVSSTDTSTSYQHLASPTDTSACYLNLVTLKLRFPCTLFNTAGMHSL